MTMQPTENEQLYDLMVERLRDYAIILLDPSGHVISWSVGAERILGYQEAEIIVQARFENSHLPCPSRQFLRCGKGAAD